VIGINSDGTTDGFYIDTSTVTHGFIKMGTTFTKVDFPNATSVLTQLLGINDKNEAVWYWQNGAGTQFPFTLQGGTFTPIDSMLPANTSAQSTVVNNAGDVWGFFVDNCGR
jgi:hypothetical protein